MPTIPTKNLEALIFCEDHQLVFMAQAANIGLSVPQATLFKNDTLAARTLWNSYNTAVEAARVAGVAMRDGLSKMRDSGGDCINLIRAFADTQANPNTVYNLAQLPPPAVPSPASPPGTPTEFKVGLNGDGSVTLKWKCANPAGTSGTVYNVYRRPAGTPESAYAPIGVVGTKNFTDTTIPASSAATGGVIYKVVAQRAEISGTPSPELNVYFGFGGGGGGGFTISSVTSNNQPVAFKNAA